MKHTFAKEVLLLGAIAISLSSVVPAWAMENVDSEVRQKTGFFAGWSKKALQDRLNSNMKSLDKQWASFMKCMKGEGCTKGQIAAITGTLTTILAIVGTLTLYKPAMKKYSDYQRSKNIERTKESRLATGKSYDAFVEKGKTTKLTDKERAAQKRKAFTARQKMASPKIGAAMDSSLITDEEQYAADKAAYEAEEEAIAKFMAIKH